MKEKVAEDNKDAKAAEDAAIADAEKEKKEAKAVEEEELAAAEKLKKEGEEPPSSGLMDTIYRILS